MTTPPEPEINDGSFGANLHRMLSDAYAKILDQPYVAQPIILSPSGKAQYDALKAAAYGTPPSTDPTALPSLSVKKLTAYMPVSCCAMTDATGTNHCEHPPPPQPSRRQRFRWAAQRWWSGLRMRLGAWIAGVDPDEWDD